MSKTIVTHIDDAPWVRGEPRVPGGPLTRAGQFIGDDKEGPWIHVNSLPAGTVFETHSHDQDEVAYIIEGELDLGDGARGPGTVIYVERHTEYGFTVGPKGVRFLNIRTGPAHTFRDGKIVVRPRA